MDMTDDRKTIGANENTSSKIPKNRTTYDMKLRLISEHKI
jgi:hypothetical protein